MLIQLICASVGLIAFIYLYTIPVLKNYFENKGNKKMVDKLDKLTLFAHRRYHN